MKKLVSILFAALLTFGALAQESVIPQRLEIVEVEVNDGQDEFEIFTVPTDGVNHFYLSVGTLGIGDEIFQINIDPLNHMYIPLGTSVSESMETLTALQDLFKGDPGDSMTVRGCVSILMPKEELEDVTVTYRRPFITRSLEFTVQRDGYIRSAFIGRSEFNSLVSGLKFYGTIHPNE